MKQVCRYLADSEADGLCGQLKQWADEFTDDFNFLDEFFAAGATDYCMTQQLFTHLPWAAADNTNFDAKTNE